MNFLQRLKTTGLFLLGASIIVGAIALLVFIWNHTQPYSAYIVAVLIALGLLFIALVFVVVFICFLAWFFTGKNIFPGWLQ